MCYDRFTRAGVAQLVEQLICNQPVGGSNPSASLSKPLNFKGFRISTLIIKFPNDYELTIDRHSIVIIFFRFISPISISLKSLKSLKKIEVLVYIGFREPIVYLYQGNTI